MAQLVQGDRGEQPEEEDDDAHHEKHAHCPHTLLTRRAAGVRRTPRDLAAPLAVPRTLTEGLRDLDRSSVCRKPALHGRERSCGPSPLGSAILTPAVTPPARRAEPFGERRGNAGPRPDIPGEPDGSPGFRAFRTGPAEPGSRTAGAVGQGAPAWVSVSQARK
ncbi:hypothetical protein GCM10023196_097080 [Actinoallomurus vinaceus]|uniref:Uncharacterized protein n=1 Tax=Actinoallomurus vinaceus TaxID=1080074 RepID=A0ABP8UUU5_9ACTN